MKHTYGYFFFFILLRKSEIFYPTDKQTEIWFNTQYLTCNRDMLNTVENSL